MTPDTFMARVTIREDGCWDWSGTHTNAGCATVTDAGRTTTAHRFAYELFVAPIDASLDADHLCFNRGCVNPSHVEPVTHRENIRRMPGMFGRRARATHCDRGHAFAVVGVVEGDGRRRCRTCRQDAARRRKAAA